MTLPQILFAGGKNLHEYYLYRKPMLLLKQIFKLNFNILKPFEFFHCSVSFRKEHFFCRKHHRKECNESFFVNNIYSQFLM